MRAVALCGIHRAKHSHIILCFSIFMMPFLASSTSSGIRWVSRYDVIKISEARVSGVSYISHGWFRYCSDTTEQWNGVVMQLSLFQYSLPLIRLKIFSVWLDLIDLNWVNMGESFHTAHTLNQSSWLFLIAVTFFFPFFNIINHLFHTIWVISNSFFYEKQKPTLRFLLIAY